MKATTPRTTSTPSGGSPTHGVSEPASAPTLSAATGEQPAPARPRRRGFTPGSGILRDIRARAPFYKSDWTDAWNYRVIPATCLIFFANVLPGIAFSLDLIEQTGQYGVAEVLLSSFIAAAVFAFFGAQPLCIAGVTGPITVLNGTIYTILRGQPDSPDYLQFMGWVYLWGAILHWITAVLNWCNFLRYVTLFPCDTFGFYVSWGEFIFLDFLSRNVYLQYGVQVITRQFPASSSPTGAEASSWLVSLILALLMVVATFFLQAISKTDLFHRHVRRFFADYGMPIALIASSAMAYWGRFNSANPATLPVGGAFEAAGGRPWLVRFWDLEGKWVGIAFPFGVALYVLFFFDHNVSSLMAQGSQFPLRKPAGFHHDFFLLGITTFIAGLLGVPAPNGLIPQAPIHTSSLLIMGHEAKKLDEESNAGSEKTRASRPTVPHRPAPPPAAAEGDADLERTASRTPQQEQDSQEALPSARPAQQRKHHSHYDSEPDPSFLAPKEVPVAVVEQRVSNLAQGALCLVLLTKPFLHVLGLIPRGVLAGLFWSMGLEALLENGVTQKLVYFFRDDKVVPPSEPLRRVRPSRLALFVGIQLVGFAATFAITQTIAAIGFPIVIFALVPIRMYIIPRLPFTEEELAILDGPAASSFTMQSVGGDAAH